MKRNVGQKGCERVGYIDEKDLHKKIEAGTLYAIEAINPDGTRQMTCFVNISPEEYKEDLRELVKIDNDAILGHMNNLSLDGVYYGNFISDRKNRGCGSAVAKEVGKICKENGTDIIMAGVERKNYPSINSIAKTGTTLLFPQNNFELRNILGTTSKLSAIFTFSFTDENFKKFVLDKSVIPNTKEQIVLDNDKDWQKIADRNYKQNRVIYFEGNKIVANEINKDTFMSKTNEMYYKKNKQKEFENIISCGKELSVLDYDLLKMVK